VSFLAEELASLGLGSKFTASFRGVTVDELPQGLSVMEGICLELSKRSSLLTRFDKKKSHLQDKLPFPLGHASAVAPPQIRASEEGGSL